MRLAIHLRAYIPLYVMAIGFVLLAPVRPPVTKSSPNGASALGTTGAGPQSGTEVGGPGGPPGANAGGGPGAGAGTAAGGGTVLAAGTAGSGGKTAATGANAT